MHLAPSAVTWIRMQHDNCIASGLLSIVEVKKTFDRCYKKKQGVIITPLYIFLISCEM